MDATTNERVFGLAVQHHQAGRFAEAERLYRQALAARPEWPEALHYLGILACQTQRVAEAIGLIERALALKPDYVEAYGSLGVALKAGGRLEEAITAYRRAIALRPDYADGHNNLGNALRETGRVAEAIGAYRRAIELRAAFPEAHNNLGNALGDAGDLDGATAAYRRAIELRPDYPEATSNLGNALRDRGEFDEAIAACRRAIALRPAYAMAYNNLGNALRDKGLVDEAMAAYRQAIGLRPTFPEAYANLGSALRDRGLLDEALEACRQAVAVGPDCAVGHNNLGNVLKDTGRIGEAIAAYRQAVAVRPGYCEAHSNLVFALHFDALQEAPAMAEEHRAWARQHAEALRACIRPHGNDRTRARRLRVGYVSPDLREHVVARFMRPLLAQHDKSQVEVFAYAQVARPDAMTERLRSHVDNWRSTVGLADEQVAELIRRDGIDILVDLAGHTAGNRLLVFARKPAPVQVTYLGYPDTTGLATMDYRLTNAQADPPGLTEGYHTEQLVRLAECAWCFEPQETPAAGRSSGGPVTFGSFNYFGKVTAPMLDLWGRILSAVPDSRLLLKASAMESPAVRRRVEDQLAGQGIARERLLLRGRTPTHADHMAVYGQVDIALDTFPYHGTTTTCEAMWMGVPVVTLAGTTHVSRVGASLLTAVGLHELIADSPAEYVRIAADLAGDRERLATLRGQLRQRMAHSPLTDGRRLARAVEGAYREMWERWCAAT